VATVLAERLKVKRILVQALRVNRGRELISQGNCKDFSLQRRVGYTEFVYLITPIGELG
jgi:hypothetical protein